MITVLMGRTSSQSEIGLPNAYHITELPECSDSMIEDRLHRPTPCTGSQEQAPADTWEYCPVGAILATKGILRNQPSLDLDCKWA